MGAGLFNSVTQKRPVIEKFENLNGKTYTGVYLHDPKKALELAFIRGLK